MPLAVDPKRPKQNLGHHPRLARIAKKKKPASALGDDPAQFMLFWGLSERAYREKLFADFCLLPTARRLGGIAFASGTGAGASRRKLAVAHVAGAMAALPGCHFARHVASFNPWPLRPGSGNRGSVMALNDLGEQIFERPVSLPRFNLPAYDDSEERKERAAKLAEQRTIRAGRDAWQAINKAESFGGFLAIGAALLIGRDHALRATGLNTPHGRRYSLALREMDEGSRIWQHVKHNAQAHHHVDGERCGR